MSDDIKVVYINDFGGGLNTKVPSHLLPQNQSKDIRNVDIDLLPGSMKKRRGITPYKTALASVTAVKAGTVYKNTLSASIAMVLNAGTNLYRDTASGFSKITTDSLNTSGVSRFATLNDVLYMVNGYDIPMKWTTGMGFATTVSSTVGTSYNPPTGTYFVSTYDNRLWMASSDTYPSRLWHSAVGDNGQPTPEDWGLSTPTDRATGYVDIDANDGDYINGLAVLPDRIYIFKRWSIHVLTGHSTDTYTIRRLASNVGCIAPDTIAISENIVLFLDRNGVYSIDTDGSVRPMSDNIQSLIDGISDKTLCKAEIRKNQYWLSYNSAGTNNGVLCLNFKRGAWVKYTGLSLDSFIVDDTTDKFYGGSSITGVVYQLDTGTSDSGTAINMHYETPDIDMNMFDRSKDFKKAYILAKRPTTTASIQVASSLDTTGKNDTTSLTIGTSITAAKINFAQGNDGQFFGLIVDDNSTNELEVYGISLYGDPQLTR